MLCPKGSVLARAGCVTATTTVKTARMKTRVSPPSVSPLLSPVRMTPAPACLPARSVTGEMTALTIRMRALSVVSACEALIRASSAVLFQDLIKNIGHLNSKFGLDESCLKPF